MSPENAGAENISLFCSGKTAITKTARVLLVLAL
jgi:hypothetical protein